MALTRRPTVLTVHDPHGARSLARADAVIVHTAHARERLLGAPWRLDPTRVEVVHHGPLELAEAGALPAELRPPAPDRPVVLCFGLIRPYKGIETLLSAWEQVTGAELWIVGRPLSALEVTPVPGVSWLPRYVSPAEQAALFAAADIVVLPYLASARFGFSGVLATAMAAATAPVVSELPGFAEAIGAGAARPVPPGDPDALAAALQALIDDPVQRTALGMAASRAATERFSWDRAAAQTLAIYERVAGR